MVGGKPCYCISGLSFVGVPHIYFVASVGIKGGANVPSIFAVYGPGFSVLRFLVSYDMHSWRGKWSGVVIERSMEAFMS